MDKICKIIKELLTKSLGHSIKDEWTTKTGSQYYVVEKEEKKYCISINTKAPLKFVFSQEAIKFFYTGNSLKMLEQKIVEVLK